MKLVFVGGVQGAGKSMLLSGLENSSKGKIKLLNPGELFRRYFYLKKRKALKEIEGLIIRKILKMPANSIVVLHWHYAVRRPGGFIPQVSFSQLKKLAESGKIEKVVLINLLVPADIILKRRLKDYRTKQRSLSRATIKKEIGANQKFLIKHRIIFSRSIGRYKVVVFHLENRNLRTARRRFFKIFEALLG